MDMRLALYEIAATHRLDAMAVARLERLGGLHAEPVDLARLLPRGVAVLAAALGGMGAIFWVASNWDTLGRVVQFGLLQTLVVVMCLGAWWKPAARSAFGLAALLAMGALFAYFGQTYQTGVDAWQLFALWAALALPLCMGARSDVLWAPWVLVAMTAIALWVQTHTGHRFRADPQDLTICLIGWGAMLALVGAMSSMLARFTGAGMWAWRAALTLAVVSITGPAVLSLLGSQVGWLYALAIAALACMALAMAWPSTFEVYGMSAVALALNTLLAVRLAIWLMQDASGSFIVELLITGVTAAALLASSIAGVSWLSRRYALPDKTRGAGL